jgi:hypothetical protein
MNKDETFFSMAVTAIQISVLMPGHYFWSIFNLKKLQIKTLEDMPHHSHSLQA